MLLTVIVALPCFIVWELGERHPAVHLKSFAHRNFAIGVACLTLGFLAIQGLLSLFIVQLQLILAIFLLSRRHGFSVHPSIRGAADRDDARDM